MDLAQLSAAELRKREKELEVELANVKNLLKNLKDLPKDLHRVHGIVHDSARLLLQEAEGLHSFVQDQLLPLQKEIKVFADNIRDITLRAKQLWHASYQQAIEHGELRDVTATMQKKSTPLLDRYFTLHAHIDRTQQLILRKCCELVDNAREVRIGAEVLDKLRRV